MSRVNLSNKGVSSVVSGLLVAYILAGSILTIMILPRYIGSEARSGVRQEEELREQFLEDLAVSIDNQDNASTVLTVTNNGDVTAHLVGVSRRYEGRIGTTRLDIRLAPMESRTITIPAGSYDQIGVLTDRGNLYPVKTEPFVLTVLEGTVIDSETGEPVGSSIRGDVQSKTIQIELETDEFGEFRVVLPNNLVPGTHQFQLTASSIGYDKKIVAGEIKRGESKKIVIELDYNPFEISMDNEGSMSRRWVENTYEKVVIENFPAKRQVLDHYKYEPAYKMHVNFNSINDDHHRWGAFKNHLDKIAYDLGGRGALRTFYHLEDRRDEDFWLHTYIKRFHRSRYDWLTKKLEPNSFEEWDYGFQVFQGFYDWRKETVRVNIPGSVPARFNLWVPHQKKFLYDHGSYKVPVYKEEEYTRWRTTTYQINDWTPENCPAINAQITLTGTNGYEGDVQLSVTTNTELLDASLENQVVDVGSTATTNLTIQPQRELSGSTHTITVTAQDDYGGMEKQVAYSLELQTPEKPPIENTILSIEETDVKPSDPTEPPTHKPGSRLGVEGSVYDATEPKSGVSDGLSVTVDGHSAGKVWRNNYRYIGVCDAPSFDGHTFIITAKADGYVRQTVTAFDYEGDYKLAHKDIYLQPESGW